MSYPPVSYTHLDVYKRQLQVNGSVLIICNRRADVKLEPAFKRSFEDSINRRYSQDGAYVSKLSVKNPRHCSALSPRILREEMFKLILSYF